MDFETEIFSLMVEECSADIAEFGRKCILQRQARSVATVNSAPFRSRDSLSTPSESTSTEVLQEAREALSLEDVDLGHVVKMLDSVHDSPEKHYLLAICLLRTQKGTENAGEAISNITRACKDDPANPIYRGLVESLLHSRLKDDLKKELTASRQTIATAEEELKRL